MQTWANSALLNNHKPLPQWSPNTLKSIYWQPHCILSHWDRSNYCQMWQLPTLGLHSCTKSLRLTGQWCERSSSRRICCGWRWFGWGCLEGGSCSRGKRRCWGLGWGWRCRCWGSRFDTPRIGSLRLSSLVQGQRHLLLAGIGFALGCWLVRYPSLLIGKCWWRLQGLMRVPQ